MRSLSKTATPPVASGVRRAPSERSSRLSKNSKSAAEESRRGTCLGPPRHSRKAAPSTVETGEQDAQELQRVDAPNIPDQCAQATPTQCSPQRCVEFPGEDEKVAVGWLWGEPTDQTATGRSGDTAAGSLDHETSEVMQRLLEVGLGNQISEDKRYLGSFCAVPSKSADASYGPQQDPPLAAVQELERSIQRRTAELRDEVARLHDAKVAVLREEAVAELRREAAREVEEFELLLQGRLEKALLEFDGWLQPVVNQYDKALEALDGCTAELGHLKAEALQRAESLDQVLSQCSVEFQQAAQENLQARCKRRREKVQADLKLIRDQIEPNAT